MYCLFTLIGKTTSHSIYSKLEEILINFHQKNEQCTILIDLGIMQFLNQVRAAPGFLNHFDADVGMCVSAPEAMNN